ncbi:MAG: ribosomal RNA small subunit methyltransferase A [Peptococcaceae bacterium]|nr:ribosomal RNA small subunit methyltransferase A [Peptococcaceae bacterium]
MAYTRRVLRNGAHAKKSLGQNFLIDDQVIERIVGEGIPEGEFPLVEIGPGPGGLTRVLLQKNRRLWAVELDAEKINILEKEFSDKALILLHMDALKLQLSELWSGEKGWLIGNLPYYITNPILMHYLKQRELLYGMTVMVQKEVALRMVALPGSKDYGILSIAVQLFSDAKILFDVQPASFWPQPKVTSAVLKLVIRSYPEFDADYQLFFKVVKAAFSQRRKTILNTLSSGLALPKEELSKLLSLAEVDEKNRAENISIIEYQKITNILAAMK